MQLAPLRPVLDHEGPLLTVYLEGRPPSEDAPEQVRKRWKALRERAAYDGAGDAVLDAAEAALFGGEAGEVQADGRVLVAAPGDDGGDGARVLLDEPWDAALGSGDHVHWTVLAELGALVREEQRSVRMLVAVADQQGARVRHEVVTREHEPREMAADTVEGDAIEGAHKPREGALAHNRIQRRADEAVKHNAQDVAAHLSRAASDFRARVMVLAGEVQGRTAIRAELPEKLAEICVEASRGGAEDDGAEQALTEELHRIAAEETVRSGTAYAGRFQESAAHGLAVQGADSVAGAAEMGAVATLLLEPGRAATREAFLLQACAVTDADVGLVDAETHLDDGAGALLRFSLEESGQA